MSSSSRRAVRRPAVHVVAAVHVGVVDAGLQPVPPCAASRSTPASRSAGSAWLASRTAFKRRAYCSAASGSCTEHGPAITSSASPEPSSTARTSARLCSARWPWPRRSSGSSSSGAGRGKQRVVAGDSSITGARLMGASSLPGGQLPGPREPAHPIAIQGCLSSLLAPGGDKRRRERPAPPGARVKRRYRRDTRPMLPTAAHPRIRTAAGRRPVTGPRAVMRARASEFLMRAQNSA